LLPEDLHSIIEDSRHDGEVEKRLSLGCKVGKGKTKD